MCAWECLGVALLGSAVCLVGCGGSAGAGGTGGNGGSDAGVITFDAGPACPNDAAAVTISGALSGTRAIDGASGYWYIPSGPGNVGFDATLTDTPFSSFGLFGFTTEPQLGTYSESTAGIQCAIEVIGPGTSSNLVWVFGSGADSSVQGSCSLTLTSIVTRPSLFTNTKEYCVHGSMTGSLFPAMGSDAQGTVTLQASF